MVIANPIYDVVFKRLMENERVAKFFIGTLLDETVERVEVIPQEFTYTKELGGMSLFRLDFIATIKTKTGEYQKLLIEVQKSRNEIDLMRFRNYLAEQYKKEDKIDDDSVVLPITTIYILGFKLPEIESPCIRVKRNYLDLIDKKVINRKSEFVEKLTHDSFIVQVERIEGKVQTRLDKLLSIFEQRYFVDDREIIKDYPYATDDETVNLMIDILHYAGTTPEEKRKIENEQEAWRTIEAMWKERSQKMLREFNLTKKQLEENHKILEETERVLEEKEKVLDEKDKVLEGKDKELEDSRKLIIELKKKLGSV